MRTGADPVLRLVAEALAEDIGTGDVTTAATVPLTIRRTVVSSLTFTLTVPVFVFTERTLPSTFSTVPEAAGRCPPAPPRKIPP